MAKIEVHFKKVRSVGNDFNSHTSHLTTSISKVASATSLVDYRIKQRRNIASDIHQVNDSLRTLKSDLTKLQSFIVKSADCYEKAEKKVEKLAKELNKKTPFEIAKDFNKHIGNVVKIIQATKTNALRVTTKMKLYFENGSLKVRYVLDGLNLSQSRDYFAVRDALNQTFGGNTARYTKRFVMELANGLPLYTLAGLLQGGIKNRAAFEKFKILKDSPTYKKNVAKTKELFKKLVKEEAKSTYKNFFIRASDTKLDKAGKLLGAAGTVFDVVSNIGDARKEKTAQGKFTTFTSGMAVDVGVGIGSTVVGMQAGSLVGSFFVPPIGTVVGGVAGAAVGVGIGLAMDWKFIPTKTGNISLGDGAKKVLKTGLDTAINVGKVLKHPTKIIDSIGSGIKSKWKAISCW